MVTSITYSFTVGMKPTLVFKDPTGKYEDLTVVIEVGSTELTCVSVNGVTLDCARTSPPYVSFPSSFTVKAWLKESVAEDICDWIDESGVANLTFTHAYYVYLLSIGSVSGAETQYNALSPKPSRLSNELATFKNALGIYDYSIGSYHGGNYETGCEYAG